MYTTSGVLRTIELILGLPPMSQYDAAATPMYNAFQATPVATPFVHIAPRVPIDEKNLPTAWGADASLRMDFSEPDRAPERELTEIIWRSVRGPAAEVPPPVRSGFVHRADADDDDR